MEIKECHHKITIEFMGHTITKYCDIHAELEKIAKEKNRDIKIITNSFLYYFIEKIENNDITHY